MQLRTDHVQRVRGVGGQQNALNPAVIRGFDILGGNAGLQTV